MTTSADPRKAASDKLTDLIAALQAHNSGATKGVVEECEALGRAIAAFHMEGIRFRIFNVDRLISRSDAPAPAEARGLLEEVRHHLEAAGFHTRSHQAPG